MTGQGEATDRSDKAREEVIRGLMHRASDDGDFETTASLLAVLIPDWAPPEDARQLVEWVREHRRRLFECRAGALENYWLKSWHATIDWALQQVGWWRLALAGDLSDLPGFQEEARAREFARGRLDEVSRQLVEAFELIIKSEYRRRRIRENDLLPPPEPKVSEHERRRSPDLWTDEDGRPFDPEFMPRDSRYDPERYPGWTREKWQRRRFKCSRCRSVFVGRKAWIAHERITGHPLDREWWPRLWFIPSYRHASCGLVMPESYVSRAKREGRNEVLCPSCGKYVPIASLAFHDPNDYGRRACAQCLRIFRLDRFNYRRQGYWCPDCKERWETVRKNLKRPKKPSEPFGL